MSANGTHTTSMYTVQSIRTYGHVDIQHIYVISGIYYITHYSYTSYIIYTYVYISYIIYSNVYVKYIAIFVQRCWCRIVCSCGVNYSVVCRFVCGCVDWSVCVDWCGLQCVVQIGVWIGVVYSMVCRLVYDCGVNYSAVCRLLCGCVDWCGLQCGVQIGV